eukprot:gene12118-25424_t
MLSFMPKGNVLIYHEEWIFGTIFAKNGLHDESYAMNKGSTIATATRITVYKQAPENKIWWLELSLSILQSSVLKSDFNNNIFRMLILRSLSLCPFLLTLLNCNGFIRIPSMKTRNVILNAGAPDMNWDPNSAPKLNFDEDYYSVLEIPPECTPQELKKKYLKLVFQYHPDNKENEQSKNLANKQMMVINNAYKILKDSEKRAEYDRKKRIKDSYKESKSSTRNNKYSTSGSSSASTSSSSQQSKSTQQSNFNENFEYPPWAKAYSYGGNAAEEDEDSSSESMVDVLSDLFSELRKDGGQSVLRDFTEFLEEQ